MEKFEMKKRRKIHKCRQVICAVCDSPFETNHSRSKYCSPPCAHEGLRASGRRTHYRRQEAFGDKLNAEKKEWRQSPKGKRLAQGYTKAYREKFPEKWKAVYTVANALKSGRLVKMPCENCGTKKHIHAHHRDYSKPLDVQWLCDPCHRAEHPPRRNPLPRRPSASMGRG